MKGYFFVIIVFFTIGCTDKTKSADNIIPKQKMSVILWDMIKVDEFASSFIAKDSLKDIKKERIKLYQRVFQIHNISEKEFSASFKYYSGRPDAMKILFDTLGARAERERQNVYLPRDSQPK